MFEDGIKETVCRAAGIFSRTRDLVTGLQIDAKRMRENMDLSKGSIFSEAMMMAAASEFGRGESHEALREIFLKSEVGSVSFLDAVAASPLGELLGKAIGDNTAGHQINGLCRDYALHYSALAEDFTVEWVPSRRARSIAEKI